MRRLQVLIAVDQSEAASAAVRIGGRIAAAIGAHVTVLHVDHEERESAIPGPASGALDELAALGVKARIELRGGDPVEEILACSRGLRSDLLVMGSRGRSNLAGMLLGSVSQDVTARVGCPVLVVRAESKTPRRSGTMLLAIEGEKGLDSLVSITATLAKALDSAVTVVHVSYPGGEELERAVYHADKTHGEHALSLAVARLVKAGVEARPMSLTARIGVSRALAKCADDMGADLIVMGSHRAEPAAGEILAPIATSVSHLTKRPIVVTGELDETK